MDVSCVERMIQDDMKTGSDMCEEEENDVKQSVGGVSFYDDVSGEMWDPNLVKEDLRPLRKMQVYDYAD